MRKILLFSIVLLLSLGLGMSAAEEMTIDQQKQALLGEWRCEWPGVHGDRSTLIIHEIDADKGKARCTLIQGMLRKSSMGFWRIISPVQTQNSHLKWRERIMKKILRVSFIRTH
jgi:hypothetical protein